MGALTDFIEKWFGVKTRVIPVDHLTVAAPAVEMVVNNNPDRLMLTMINLSGTNIIVSPDRNPTATHGVHLALGGGAVTLNASIDGVLVGYEWYSYCVNANEELYVIELEAR